MATATRKNPTPPPPPKRDGEVKEGSKPEGSLVIRAFDAIFRFLASVKLAVFCLGTLAATLAFGTKFNSDHGMAAAGEYIYQTRWFALLLAFLAMNILCAALIRYPWTKRQTGFLITHAGLLTVIGGSWWAAQGFDEGRLGMREGETSSKLIRTEKPSIYVRPIDPHTGKDEGQYNLPFRPGTFDWPAGRYEVVSNPKDPFKLAVKKFYVASRPRTIFVPDPAGSPMAKIRPRLKPPRSDGFMDAFPSEEDRWFVPPTRGVQRIVKDVSPAQFIFSYNESHENFDDFLDAPADPGKEGVARLRYEDKAGKSKFLDVRIDDAQPGKPITLPDSDLTATFLKVEHVPLDNASIRSMTGEDQLNIVQFNVRQGNGPEIEHNGYALLPTIPPIVPKRDSPTEPPKPLLQINYYLPPLVDPQVNGRFGVVEVMGDDHGRLAYRVFGRGTPGKLGPHGLLKLNEEVTAFGGNELAPMTMKFSVEEFLQAGREEDVAESIDLPINKKDEGISAALVELTVKGVTKEFWLRKSPTFDPIYHRVIFPDAIYEVALDSDRMDLGFSLTLDDFDVGFDPGTQEASSFRSEVRLTDEAEKIKDKPVSIYMNNTLDHRGWRFFQSSYQRHYDPKTGRPTGEFISVFQVARNPARELIYIGCIVVVLGAFVQFYMRAGIFTDGGKYQQAKAAEKARKRLEAKFGKPLAPSSPIESQTEADEPL
jgi:ResB-like family